LLKEERAECEKGNAQQGGTTGKGKRTSKKLQSGEANEAKGGNGKKHGLKKRGGRL